MLVAEIPFGELGTHVEIEGLLVWLDRDPALQAAFKKLDRRKCRLV